MKGLTTLGVLSLTLLMGVDASIAQSRPVTIEGLTDCSMWVDARNRNISTALEHYLLGLLNGLAIGSGADFWRVSGVSINKEQAFLWMDKYCRDTPLSDPIRGAVSLMNERTNNEFQRRISR